MKTIKIRVIFQQFSFQQAVSTILQYATLCDFLLIPIL